MGDEVKLKTCLSKYKNPDMTRREVINVIQFYKSLTFKYDKFTFNDGTCMDLVNLDGTVPVLYRQNFYNIPVCVWLMDTHPAHAPLCFVNPTADMSIKVSKYVDNNGRVYLPYLHDWKPGESTLLQLIQIMIGAFGELPPVYAKPANEQQAKMLPYPTASFMPQPGSAQPQSNYLPYPAYPTQPGPGYPPATSPYPNHSPYPQPYPPNVYNQYPANSVSQPYPGYPPAANIPVAGGGTITEEHIKASLFSAVEDKLRRRMREQYQQNQAELETLRRTQQELNDGKAQLDGILIRLEKESLELDKNIAILQEKDQELEASIEKLSGQENIDPDDAVTTTSPLYNQLLVAFAEEATTEDAIYYMGEALRKGVIDLDAFLKQVRALSGKQFTLRILMQKCRQKAGLAC